MQSTPAPSLSHLLVTQIRARLRSAPTDNADFVGQPVDISELTPLELGSLWSDLHRASFLGGSQFGPNAAKLAQSILHQCSSLGREPALDASACIDLFENINVHAWDWAIECLSYLACEPPPELARFLRRMLDVDTERWTRDSESRYQAYALARRIDEATLDEVRQAVAARFSECPLRLREFALLDQLAYPAVLAMAGKLIDHVGMLEQWGTADPAITLSREPTYLEFAQEVLVESVRRLEDIHAGLVPYQSDTAFALEDTAVIARAVRVAALRDDVWLRPLIMRLLPLSCVAPTSAKTAPSQSLAIGLGHSVESAPTPEGVDALREALHIVRHAGLKKKLSRNLKPAERGLAERPHVALRLASASAPGKRQMALLAVCLEAGFCQRLELPFEDWCTQLARSAVGAPLARNLVWSARTTDGARISFMPEKAGPPLRAFDCAGEPVTIAADARIALWHPVLADDAERHAWQALLAARRIRQPFRQVYREYYARHTDELVDSATNEFAAHTVSNRPLVGLARREGWSFDRDLGLLREFGDVWASFRLTADLYPGAEGWSETLDLRFFTRHSRRWNARAIGDVDPVIFSEACRAVDLLVSVAGFAVEMDETKGPITAADLGVHLAGEPAPAFQKPEHPALARGRRLRHLGELALGDMAQMRRNVLTRAFAQPIADGAITVEPRHIRVGSYAVHLSTARVTRAGAPIELQLAGRGKLKAVPWLPYDENLLQKIVDSVCVLMEQGETR